MFRALIWAALLLTLSAAPAGAEEDSRWVRYNIRQARKSCDLFGRCTYPRQYAPNYVRHYRVPQYDQPAEVDHGRCRDTRRAVGDQHLTLDGAKRAANDAWSATVRFHLGEKFMDLKNARFVSYECSRSSIKDASVTTLGQTLTRCEIEATPCRPGRQQDSPE